VSNLFTCPFGEEDNARTHSRKEYFVGYSETAKAFCIYIPSLRKTIVRQDVRFEDIAFKRSQGFE
jgi:hypothetical protein